MENGSNLWVQDLPISAGGARPTNRAIGTRPARSDGKQWDPRVSSSPQKQTEYGFGYNIVRSPYTPYSIYFRWTIMLRDPEMHKVGEERAGSSQEIVNACGSKYEGRGPSIHTQTVNPKP